VRDRPLHRVDVRLQKSFPIVNHANYGSYTTNLANAQYGRPAENGALAYQPRMMQLGIKFTF
jgi:hypothetical protein